MSTAKTKLARVRAKLSILTRIQSSLSVSRHSQEREESHVNIPDSWKESFENLLADERGVHAFTKFLRKEHSEENMEFWVACTNYAAVSDNEQRAVEAKRIYAQYLSETASEPVNVDSQALRLVREDLANPTKTTFEVARKQIFVLMKTDSYRRFLKSETCAACGTCTSDTISISSNSSPKPLKRLREKLKEVAGSTSPSSSQTSSPSHRLSQPSSSRLPVSNVPKHNFSTGDLQTLEISNRPLDSNGAIRKVLIPQIPERTRRVKVDTEIVIEKLVPPPNTPYKTIPIKMMDEKENSDEMILGITMEENENITLTTTPESSSFSTPTHTRGSFKIISDDELQSAISEVRALTDSMKQELVKSVHPKLEAIRRRCSEIASSFEEHELPSGTGSGLDL